MNTMEGNRTQRPQPDRITQAAWILAAKKWESHKNKWMYKSLKTTAMQQKLQLKTLKHTKN